MKLTRNGNAVSQTSGKLLIPFETHEFGTLKFETHKFNIVRSCFALNLYTVVLA